MLSRSPRGGCYSLGASAPFLLRPRKFLSAGGLNLIQNPNFRSSAVVHSGLHATQEIAYVHSTSNVRRRSNI